MRLFFDPAFVGRVVAEGEDALLPARSDAAFILGYVHEDIQVAQGVVLRIRRGDALYDTTGKRVR
jgi:hypothetical protein